MTLGREGVEVASVASSVRRLAQDAPAGGIDIALLCCDRTSLEDPGEIQSLRSDLPDIGIVVVCAADGRRAVRRALAAGADGYVCEADLERALGPTLRAVHSDQLCVPRDMREHFQRPAFSFREKQVLQLVARGCTNGEIAQTLFLAESTVKSHLSSSFRKLGVSSRKEAAAIVLDPDAGLNLDTVDTNGSTGLPDLAVTSP